MCAVELMKGINGKVALQHKRIEVARKIHFHQIPDTQQKALSDLPQLRTDYLLLQLNIFSIFSIRAQIICLVSINPVHICLVLSTSAHNTLLCT
jgi:hypothetical protein